MVGGACFWEGVGWFFTLALTPRSYRESGTFLSSSHHRHGLHVCQIRTHSIKYLRGVLVTSKTDKSLSILALTLTFDSKFLSAIWSICCHPGIIGNHCAKYDKLPSYVK